MKKEEIKSNEEWIARYAELREKTNLYFAIPMLKEEMQAEAVRYALSEAAENAKTDEEYLPTSDRVAIWIDKNSILSLEEKILQDLK